MLNNCSTAEHTPVVCHSDAGGIYLHRIEIHPAPPSLFRNGSCIFKFSNCFIIKLNPHPFQRFQKRLIRIRAYAITRR